MGLIHSFPTRVPDGVVEGDGGRKEEQVFADSKDR
jgi:hypothetical protein